MKSSDCVSRLWHGKAEDEGSELNDFIDDDDEIPHSLSRTLLGTKPDVPHHNDTEDIEMYEEGRLKHNSLYFAVLHNSSF